VRLMTRQAKGQAAVINAAQLDQGADAVRAQLDALKAQGINYVVLDALHEQHLLTQGEALKETRLVTGGSGLAIGIARAWATQQQNSDAEHAGRPQGDRAVVISGSCSQMTNRQVQAYRQQAPSHEVLVERCLDNAESYAQELCDWVAAHHQPELAPLLFATADAQQLQAIQQQYGAARSSEAVEQLFAAVTRELKTRGWQRFIVAGGETSGVVAQSLGVTAFHIGPMISPGVPWVRDIHQPLSLALKSGNFGDEQFFARAQQEYSA